VTDADSVAAAGERVRDATAGSGLAALVNNAGIAVTAPLEFVPIPEFRNQLEVNVIGQVAVTQALLGSLRAARGRIVNVSSIGGRIALPLAGPYAASKFALEALSDCLRVELRPWGIQTIAIEPGSIATEIWESGAQAFTQLRKRMPPEAMDLYGEAIEATARASAETGARGIPPERAAEVIEKALSARRPRARYLVGRDARGMAAGKRLMPPKLYDRITARVLRLP